MLAELSLVLYLLAQPSMARLLPSMPTATPPALSSYARSKLQFRRFTMADGLPSSRVRNVAQDAAGFIWIASDAGLICYNGTRFDVFQRDIDKPGSLAGNQQSAMLVDRAGRLWSGGEDSGLNLYASDGKFRSWQHRQSDETSLAGDDVTAIAQTADGSLWVALDGRGVDRMRADGRGFEHRRHRPGDRTSLASDRVTSLLADTAGRLWIGTMAGLDRLDAEGRLSHVPVVGVSGAVAVNAIDGAGDDLRVATNRGLLRLDANGRLRPLPGLPAMAVQSSMRDRTGVLWVATAAGLYLQERDGRIIHVEPRPLLPDGLPGRDIVRILEDREGGIWFAIADGGLAYLGPHWEQFFRVTHVPDDPTSLPGRGATAVAVAADGRVWVGGQRGWIRRVDPLTGEVSDDVADAPSPIDAMLEDRRGRLWLGLRDGLVLHQHSSRDDFAQVLPHTTPGQIVEGPDGRIYVSPLREGVKVIDPDTLAVSTLPLAGPGDELIETRQLVFADGVLWRASTAGLTRWDATRGRMAFVDGVEHGRANSVAFDHEGFWLARPDALERYRWYDGHALLVDTIDRARGWPRTDMLSIRVDRHGRVWGFGINVLWSYDPVLARARVYGIADGLFGTEFTSGNTVAMADGTILATTIDGLIGFDPNDRREAVPAPSVVPTRVTVRRGGELVDLPVDGRAIELGWRDRDLAVEVRALSFIDAAANRYRFRLSGRDLDWVDQGQRGYREFYGLPAGDYALEVQGAGPTGTWGRLRQPLHIHVQAPPWQRWWAWLAYLLTAWSLVVACLWGIQRGMRRRVQVELAEQQRRLAELASQAKTRFIGMLGHEIRTPMTGVLGMAELLAHTPLNETQQGYLGTMRQSGTLMLKLVNNALDLARIEADRLELEPTCFDPLLLVRQVVDIERPLAHARGLALQLTLPAAAIGTFMGDELRIRQILLNLVANAIKFTERGEVCVTVRRCGDGLEFDVADTGPGIGAGDVERLFKDYEQAHTPQRMAGAGLGLAICRELATLMGGRIEVQSTPGKGSTFTVALPLPCVDSPTAATCPLASPPMAIRPRRILLVEDDPAVSEVITGLLRHAGHRVLNAAHALDALSVLEEVEVELIMLDLDLPGIDGFALARMLRQREALAQVAIVAVSARSAGDEILLTQAVGMQGFVRKPVSGAELDALMRTLDDATCRAC